MLVFSRTKVYNGIMENLGFLCYPDVIYRRHFCMKSVKELNQIADGAAKSVYKTVEALVDPQSFVESDRFIRSETALGDAVGEGAVSGFASIGDIQVGLFAVNGEVLKGGIGKANSRKIAKCVTNAVKTGAPVVGIIDTLGARFAEGIEAMEGYGAILAAFSEAYGNVPTVLVVKGGNYGMLSYLTAVTDFTVCYEKSVTATSSPLLLVAGTTEDAGKVGTGAAMDKAGVASVVVKNDAEMANVVKSLLSMVCEVVIASNDDGNRVCKGLKAGAKTAAVIAEIFDKDTFTELKKGYGEEATVGLARLNGVAVGVVANNADVKEGRLTPPAAKKITDLINTCDSFGLPVVNIVDCKGSALCLQCQGELMRSIGEMMFAYNVAEVAKISLIKGNAVGLGYVAFANKSAFDYTVAWENATIGLLDNAASAQLVYADEIASAKNKDAAAEKLAVAYGEENTAAVTVAEKGFIDNVINPDFSRQYLIAAVQAFLEKR